MELYSREEAERLNGRIRRAGMAAVACAAVGLGVCVALCLRVNTLNALKLQWTVVTVSTLAGWAAILLWGLVVIPCRAVKKHVEWMLAGERESVCGTIRVEQERLQIPHSIAIRKARVMADGHETVVNVYDRKARLLPADGRRVRVTTVRRYMVAWEACDDEEA